MKNKNRCGAHGFLRCLEGQIFFVVSEVISEVPYPLGKGSETTLIIPPDITIGDCIPLSRICSEHRGFYISSNVFRDEMYLDEGEFEEGDDDNSFIFVSDSDAGPFCGRNAAELVDRPVEMKPDIFDRIGAAERLRRYQALIRRDMEESEF